MFKSILSKEYCPSLPLLNSKSLSPFSSIETNANVVFPSSTTISVFIFAFFNVSNKNFPKASLPICPKKYDFPPNLHTAAQTFAGAPPAFFSKFIPFTNPALISLFIKSINNSPMQNTLFIYIPTLFSYKSMLCLTWYQFHIFVSIL